MPPVLNQHIRFLPSANHGEKAVIADTRIRVVDVYFWHELQGKSAHDIIAEFPQLTLAGVYAAMAYYWDNEELIQEQIKRGDEIAEEVQKLYPLKFSKPTSRDVGEDDSVPSG